MSDGLRGLFVRLREAGRAAAEAFRGAPIAEAKLKGAGGLAQGPGATAAGEGGTAIGAVHGDVYVGPHPGNPTEMLTVYRASWHTPRAGCRSAALMSGRPTRHAPSKRSPWPRSTWTSIRRCGWNSWGSWHRRDASG